MLCIMQALDCTNKPNRGSLTMKPVMLLAEYCIWLKEWGWIISNDLLHSRCIKKGRNIYIACAALYCISAYKCLCLTYLSNINYCQTMSVSSSWWMALKRCHHHFFWQCNIHYQIKCMRTSRWLQKNLSTLLGVWHPDSCYSVLL